MLYKLIIILAKGISKAKRITILGRLFPLVMATLVTSCVSFPQQPSDNSFSSGSLTDESSDVIASIASIALSSESEIVETQRHAIFTNLDQEQGSVRLSQPYEIVSVEEEIKKILREFGEKEPIHVPDDFIMRVSHFIDIYTDPEIKREWFKRALYRFERYHPLVDGIFKNKHLPDSLHYLALVESAYVPHARSHAGAVGLWQFMKGTARQYKLKVNRYVDERKDPRKSTIAASEYLTDLILEFGHGESVLLAMASYNAGQGRVRSELRRLNNHHQRGFWSLVENGKYLKAETKNYVPQIIAAAIIGSNRTMYGFTESLQLADFQELILYSPVSIAYILEKGNISRDELLRYNPDLTQNVSTTPAGTDYHLLLPKKVAASLIKEELMVAALSESNKKKTHKVSSEEQTKLLVYRVQRGNTWEWISHWSGVSVSQLKKSNPKTARRGLKAGQKLYIKGVAKDLTCYTHQIRKGDTISELALLYSVEQGMIRKWNGLLGSILPLDKRLVVYSGKSQIQRAANPKNARYKSSKNKSASSPSVRPKRNRIVYRTKRGNTLHTVAKAFGTSIQAIKTTNGIRGTNIYVGQKLKIPVAGWERLTIRVKPGDTLARIASRYHTNFRSLQTYNGLRSSVIQIGEELIVFRKKAHN